VDITKLKPFLFIKEK